MSSVPAGFDFNEALVPTTTTRHRKRYDSYSFRGAVTGLKGTAYFNPNHIDLVFNGEFGKQRAVAAAEAMGGEYKPKGVHGAREQQRARIRYAE